MVNNKKAYSKILLLIIVLLAIIGTQSMAATVSRVTGLKSEVVSNTEVKLSWNKVTNATKYEVYVKTSGGTYNSVGTTNMTNVKMSNLPVNTTLYVKVRAYNGNTAGSFSTEIKVTTNNSSSTTLGRVTGLRQTNITENTVNVAWNKVANATRYEVYVKPSNGTYSSKGTTTNLYTTIPGLESGKTYYVKVRAYNNSGYGEFSEQLKITTNNYIRLGQVTGLRQTGVTENSVDISWNRVVNATRYEIYVKPINGTYSSKGTTANIYATISGLEAGKTYYVKVRAYNNYGDGEFSEQIRIVTNNNNSNNNKVGQVTGLRQNRVTENSADISWNNIANATGYEVYVRPSNGTYSSKGTTQNLYTTIEGLEAGKTYYVKVRAYNNYGDGEFSTELKITTNGQTVIPGVTLDKVLNLNVIPEATRAGLTWKQVSNAEGYEVYINIPGRGYISIGKTRSNDIRIMGLEEGKTYYIKVRAYKGTTYGEFSDEVKFTMQNAPTIGKVENLTSNVTGTTANLSWNKVANASQYEIFINIPGRGYVSLGTTSKDNVRVVNLSQGVTYQIKVRAIGTINGNTVYGDYSNEVTAIAR